jgi:hypothetical protein
MTSGETASGEGLDDPAEVGLRFALQVTGTTLAEGPPPPDSPLGRVMAFVEEHGEEALTQEVFASIVEAE